MNWGTVDGMIKQLSALIAVILTVLEICNIFSFTLLLSNIYLICIVKDL